MSVRCPSCGAQSSGKFCSHCGAALGTPSCAACGKTNAPGAKFCAGCGAGLGAGAGGGGAARPATGGGPSSSMMPIVVAGVAVIAAILVYVFASQPPPPPAEASTPFASGQAGGMPDLSTMTPRQQFLRLHDRVMTAAEQGDTATFNQFAPMSLMAYQNLPETDPDVRYHAATLRLHTGDIPGARALADSLTAEQKDHLFGYMLRAAIARFEGNQAATAEAYRGYLAALDGELKAARPEYAEHQNMLDNFTQTARAGVSAR